MHTGPYSEPVGAFLRTVGLPTADLASSPVVMHAIHKDDALIAIVGVEVWGQVGLLRSLAVATPHRGQRLGTRLVAQAETWSQQQGLTALYLLTESAARFFERLGYQPIPRSEAPLTITTTPQFQSLCPASATLMQKLLTA